MKKTLILFLLILIAATSFGQAIVPRASSAFTVMDSRWMGQYNAFMPRYNDTTAANLQKGIDSCGAFIYTYDVNACWFRSCYNGTKHWVQIIPAGGGTGGLGAWTTTLNTAIPTDISLNGYFGTTAANGIGFYTTNIQRVILPAAGFSQISDTTLNKPMTYNTSTKAWNYGSWFVGSTTTPTWQQTLSATNGLFLTQSNSVSGSNLYNFTFDSIGVMRFNIQNAGGKAFTVTQNAGGVRFQVTNTQTLMQSPDITTSQIKATNTQAYFSSQQQAYIAGVKNAYIFGGDSVLIGSGDASGPTITSYLNIYPRWQDQYAPDSLVWRNTARTGEVKISSNAVEIYGGTKELEVTSSGIEFTLGSDATGDIWYRNSSGFFTRLGIGSSGNVLTVAAGLPSWAALSTAVPINGLTLATGTNSLVNGNFTQTWTWPTLTSGALLITAASTAMTTASYVFGVTTSGANASNNIESRAAEFDNTHTGTGSTNNALYLIASGGATNNAIYVSAGNVNLQPLTASQFVSLDVNRNLTSTAVASSILFATLTDETGGTGVVMGNVSPSVTTSLTTVSSTFALLNTTATTVNAFGATTTLNIGASATMILNFGGSTTASEFRFLEPSASGTNYSAFKAVAQAANITYSLPPTVGAAGTQLTDVAGNGVLTWAAASSFALTNGSGTTAGATSVSLGGTATGDITIDMGGNNLSITNETSISIGGGSPVGIQITTGDGKTVLGAYNNGGNDNRFEVDDVNSKFTFYTGTVRMAVYGAGAATFSADGTISSVSDKRLKIVEGEYTKGLTSLKNIHPVYYKYNSIFDKLYRRGSSPDTTTYIGFIAQDFQREFGNESVGHDKSGYLSLNDRAVTGALVNGVNDQQKQIEQLTKRIDFLEKKLNNKK